MRCDVGASLVAAPSHPRTSSAQGTNPCSLFSKRRLCIFLVLILDCPAPVLLQALTGPILPSLLRGPNNAEVAKRDAALHTAHIALSRELHDLQAALFATASRLAEYVASSGSCSCL